MELYEYTDEELNKEIRRRRDSKLRKVRHARSSSYIYQECVVVGRRRNLYGSRINSIDILTDKDYGYHRHGCEGYVAAPGMGFNLGNLPHVGDRVVMRRRKYRSAENDWLSEWKICDIVKD